ncbi:peroxisomal carnitine O-octanoyltransferase-like isoform X1 [Haliotis rufescens]|uniref:peroxisomal carnitine O-octanoyltransferase-like isoform X1 n=2 Tax=Haliotis rufescens TaxID=6454 RepID=UPI00201F2E53|nr:peroxisomal carnitine O-octanoyltransferase-like isoform X1 [Haliotis rufescens]
MAEIWVSTELQEYIGHLMEQDVTSKKYSSMVDALMLSDTEKTFQYTDELPSLPIPPLKQTLDKYLESTKPFVTDEEYGETERIVREFEAGLGKELHLKLSEKAKYKRNWLEKWWEDYAYLEWRMPSALLVNMAGPGPYMRDIWPAKDGTQLERTALLLHYMVKFWQILRQEKLRPQKDGQGKPLCMFQFHRVYNTCKIPGLTMDKIQYYFQTETEGPAPSNVIVTCRGHYFTLECLDSEGEVKTQPEFLHHLKAIREKCDQMPRGQAIGNLTTDDRTEWAKMRSRLIARHPKNYENLEKIQQSIFLLDLTDESPSDASELAWRGLGGNADNKFFDKSLNISAHKNGLFCSNCDHAPFDAMVLVVSTYYVHVKMQEVDGKWQGSTAVRQLPPPEELTFDLDDVLQQRIKFTRDAFKELCATVEVKTGLFTDYGKQYLKSVKVHPDAHVQMALQLTYFRKYRKPAPTYETATTRRFYHARTETMRSCTVEAVDWCKSMLDARVSSQKRLQLFLRAVSRHQQLMTESQDMNGCDRHLFGLYLTAKEEGLPMPDIFTDATFFKSGGGGNYVLSTSSIGYTSVYGGVSPMCRNGYGCFYRMDSDEIGTFISSWVEDEETSAKEFTVEFHQTLRDMQTLLDHRATSARL